MCLEWAASDDIKVSAESKKAESDRRKSYEEHKVDRRIEFGLNNLLSKGERGKEETWKR